MERRTEIKKETRKWKLPVVWEVFDMVEVEAESLEEAIEWFKEHKEELPLGANPNYVDGSYQLSHDETQEISELAKELEIYNQ